MATEPDPKKVRIGLVLISIVVLVAVVLFFVIDDAVSQAIMFAVAVLGIVRVAVLLRSVRRGR
jgi:hypothetical protein